MLRCHLPFWRIMFKSKSFSWVSRGKCSTEIIRRKCCCIVGGLAVITVFIIWQAPRAGNMNQIPRSDWLSAQLAGAIQLARDCPFCFCNRELKQQTFLSSRTSDCRGGLDRQRRFWREILMLSRTRSPTQTALFCLYFLTGILERWSLQLSMPRLKDVRN